MSETDHFIDRRMTIPTAPEGWHLKKEVNISIIISVIGVAIACVTAYTDLKRDIALIKQDTAVLHQRDSLIEVSTKESIRQLQDAMIRMESKLDRLIERQK